MSIGARTLYFLASARPSASCSVNLAPSIMTGFPLVGCLIAHIENLLAGADKLSRCAMTFQAPLHLQGCELIHQRHLVDRAMARIAADSLVHVNAVIEIHKVGELVDADPLKRFFGTENFTNGFEQCSVRPNLRVAINTCLGGQDSREAGSLNLEYGNSDNQCPIQ